MKYKIILKYTGIVFEPIYRANIKAGLRFMYNKINDNIHLIEDKNNIRIIIQEPEVVVAKCYSKGIRTKYNTIKEMNFNELISEID